jgi:hypothetical protein
MTGEVLTFFDQGGCLVMCSLQPMSDGVGGEIDAYFIRLVHSELRCFCKEQSLAGECGHCDKRPIKRARRVTI